MARVDSSLFKGVELEAEAEDFSSILVIEPPNSSRRLAHCSESSSTGLSLRINALRRSTSASS